MSTALLVGQDEMLQFTRAALLRTMGVGTVCCQGSAALDMQRKRRCDLVVLCHSLPAQFSASLAQKIRACWPGTRILRVAVGEWEQVEHAVSVDMVSSGEPANFMQQAKRLLETRRAGGHTLAHRDDRKLSA